METSELKICLENDSKIYFPGEELVGKVELRLHAPLNFSAIVTSVCGIATIEHKDLNRKRFKIYFEQVFKFHCTSNGSNNMWNEGLHSHTFSCKLPKAIPSSLESPGGNIRYKISAYIDGPDELNQNLAGLKFFCVNSIVNLNALNNILKPKAVVKHSHSSWFCIKRRTISVTLNLMKRGFVAGEYMVINAVISNGSNRIIPRVEAQLIQSLVYNFEETTSKLKNIVTEVVRGPVMPQESQVWKNEKFLIPPIITSQSRQGSLIDVKYNLYFTAYQATHRENIIVKIPVIIGNVPILAEAKSFNMGSGDTPLTMEVLPVPNNEACHFGPYTITDYSGPLKSSTVYSPRYSTYCVSNVQYQETHL